MKKKLFWTQAAIQALTICGALTSSVLQVWGMYHNVAMYSIAAIILWSISMLPLLPIPLRFCKGLEEKIKADGLVHYTTAQAAKCIKRERSIRPSGRLSSYSNLFRPCVFLGLGINREGTMLFNGKKGKIDNQSEKILVPYDDELLSKARFRFIDLSVMIPGAVTI